MNALNQKRVQFISTNLSSNYMTSFVFLSQSHPSWTINSGAIDHISRDRGAFVDSHRISQETK